MILMASVACQDNRAEVSPETVKVSPGTTLRTAGSTYEFQIESDMYSLTCKGRAPFTPEDGILDSVYEDMREIGETLCGSGISITDRRSANRVYSELPEMESVQIDFSCANASSISTVKIKHITKGCEEVFSNFAAKQP